MKIDYNELEKEIIEALNKNKCMVLATSAEDRVTARMMSCVIIGTTILFQTDKKFTKYKQMQKNEKVALCVGNIQIEGRAKLRGHCFEEENKEFLSLYKESHYGSFEAYSSLKDNVVVEVKPTLITIWKYIESKPYIDTLDIENKIAERIEYKLDDIIDR